MTHDPVRAAVTQATGRMLEDLLHDAVTGMAIVGLDGRYAAVNPAMCRMLGRGERDLIGVRPADITHPDDRTVAEVTMERLLQGGIATDQVQKRYVRPDGTTVPVLRTTTVLRGEGDQPIGLFTQVVDMTEVAEAQQSVVRSERRFKALVAHASELTLVLDSEGLIRYASPAAESLVGFPAELLEGRNAFEFIHPDDVDRARATFQLHLGMAEQPDSVHYRIRHPDERGWRQAEVRVTNLLDDPSVGGVVLNVRDVTEEFLFQERLAASERKFRALVGNSWDIITVHDAAGVYLYCNPAVTAQLGYSPEELIGSDPARHLLHPDDSAATAALWAAAAAGEDLSVQYRVRHKDGSWRWMESTALDRMDDPAIGGTVITTRNVTARRRRSAQQDAVASLSSLALRGGPMETFKDHAARVVAEVLEADRCDIARRAEGTSLTVARFGLEIPRLDGTDELVERALRERRTVIWNDETGAPPSWVRSVAAARITPADGPEGVLTVRSARTGAFSQADISFLEAVANVLASAITRDRIETELRDHALHDGLTGLPNRLLLKDRLETALARMARHDTSVSVLFVDLDNFKLINDSLGHTAGDLLVTSVAQRLSEVVRSSDTVARFGGDEFVVLCEDADQASARELAERIRGAVSTPVELEGRSVTITTSIGMVTTADARMTADELLSMADTAMYASKEAGKDCSTPFAVHMRTAATERLEVLSGIRRAISNDEFRLVYQPIVSLESGHRYGFEALARWHHPTEGLLPPAHFIDHAEACGLIIPLGEWVIRTAFAQSAAWRRAGATARVSVNVSGLQLIQSDIVATVAAAIEETGAAPEDLALEVTEHAVMADLQKASAAMRALRDLGVRMCMDDFGTGHSSLAHLADLPFDYIKIDQSFVARFDRDHRAEALLEAIVRLCGALDMATVAEGVETENQMRHLTDLGIRFGQGYLFGRPAPAGRGQQNLRIAG